MCNYKSECRVGKLALFVDEDFSLLVYDCGITVIYGVYMVGKAQAIVKSKSQLYHYIEHKPERCRNVYHDCIKCNTHIATDC
jgi:hypothetical protein